MNVLHIITGLNVGGAERMLLNLVSSSDRSQFHHSVLSLKAGGTLEPRFNDEKIPVYCLPLGIFNFPRWLFRQKRLVSRLKPDVIQGWMYHGNLAAWWARKSASPSCRLMWGIRYSLSDLTNTKRTTWYLIRLGARLSSGTDRIVYNSFVSQTQHEKLGYSPQKGHRIPNGVDLNAWTPKADAKSRLCRMIGAPADSVLVGFAGRFDPEKDPYNFISAATFSAMAHPRLRFLMMGAGCDARNKKLNRTLKSIGLSDRFHLLGERTDMTDVMPGLDILTNSSRTEAFPNVLLEAMACGVPCVATQTGDTGFILGNTGFLVPPRDPKAIVSAWDRLLASPEERRDKGKLARQRVEELFSLDQVVKQYESLYETVKYDQDAVL